MAIAFDAASQSSGSGTGTRSVSHTVTGSNTFLFAWTGMNGQTEPSSVSYNSVGMTKLLNAPTIGSLWYLVNPATGSHTLSASYGDTLNSWINGVSYTGVAQTSPIDASAANFQGNASSHAVSLVTVTNNAWVVLASLCSNSAVTNSAGTNTAKRTATATTWPSAQVFDSNAAVTPAGSRTINVNYGASDDMYYVIAAIKPFVPNNGSFFYAAK